MKCLRIITQTKNVTFDRKKAEQNIDTGLLCQHMNYFSSKSAQTGNFQKANDERFAVQNLLQRNANNDMNAQNLENFSGFTYQLNQTSANQEVDSSNNMYYNMRKAKTNNKYFNRKK